MHTCIHRILIIKNKAKLKWNTPSYVLSSKNRERLIYLLFFCCTSFFFYDIEVTYFAFFASFCADVSFFKFIFRLARGTHVLKAAILSLEKGFVECDTANVALITLHFDGGAFGDS
jgi:hypothetical protein